MAAAIGLADEAGVEALTMKAVAARLGTYTPMALYRYVYSKDGLVDLMLDAAAAEVQVPVQPSRHWRDDLRKLATSTRLILKKHPWFAALAHTRPPAGPHTMRRLEFVLTVLAQQGATVADAMSYAALLDRNIFGAGLQEAEEARMNSRHELDHDDGLFAALRIMHDLAAADGSRPLLTAWLAQPGGPSADEQFEFGLEFLLNGIATRLP